MAVGSGLDQTLRESPIAYSWNGSTWTSSSIANGTLFYPYSVSCAGLTFCAATAYNPGPVNAVMVWNGSTWSVAQNVPTPSTGGTLYGISCFSPTSCTAVGNSGTNSEALTWDGQSWTQVSNPPAGAAGSTQALLFGVDCLTNWACVTAGSSEFSATSFQPLLASAPIARSGYYFVGSDGGIYNYGSGSAPFLGSMGGTKLNSPVVGMATMPAGDGYYLVAADGGVFNFGSAQFYGSTGALKLNKPVVGIAVTPDGGGYWLVASDGGIFAYGDAQFYGSMGGKPLNKPIVGIAPTPNGNGYYEVASRRRHLHLPHRRWAALPGLGRFPHPEQTGRRHGRRLHGGYYMVASDGGIFSYPSTLPFYGSTGSIKLNQPVVGLALDEQRLLPRVRRMAASSPSRPPTDRRSSGRGRPAHQRAGGGPSRVDGSLCGRSVQPAAQRQRAGVGRGLVAVEAAQRQPALARRVLHDVARRHELLLVRRPTR